MIPRIASSSLALLLLVSGAASATEPASLYAEHCAVCHGIEANGEVGPSLLGVSARKSKVKLIKQVVSGNTPPMPQFQPKPEDMADLLEYLETL